MIRVGNNENCCINGGMQDNWSLFSYEQYKQFRDNTPEFAQLAAFQSGQNQFGVRRQGSNHPAESFIGDLCLRQCLRHTRHATHMPDAC